ncbi:MAG: diguanylate cyclase [Mycobacterium sp.]|nr:diguanylate cyclase [Mycobacterium sp.]
MPAMTSRRIMLVALATAGLAFFAGLLVSGSNDSAPAGAGNAGPIGASVMVGFATACAASAAWGAHGGQRLAWIGMSVGLAGWVGGNAVWCYVAAGGTAPISTSSAATLGYLILPICALGATIMVPVRGDSRFGIGLLLDGIVVAASLFLALGSLVLGPADTVSVSRLLLAVMTAVYLGLVVITVIVARAIEPGRSSLSTWLLCAGFATIGAAGLLHVVQDRANRPPDEVVTLGWTCGAYLLALSALTYQAGPDLEPWASKPSSRLSMWLPYLPLTVGVVVGAVHFWPADLGNAVVFGTGVILVSAVLMRHLLALDRKRRLLDAMADAALRDTVTGLANQRLLDERLAHAVELHLRMVVPVSLLRVRVDDFKVVNDTLGYAASDELLRRVGARMQASVRAADTVARLGGDEFAILVEDQPEVAVQVAQRVARAFDSALVVGDNRVYVHLSIGVATALHYDEPPTTAADLLSQAESALARAQQTSATDVQIFTPEKDAHLGRRQTFRAGVERLQLLWDLRRAIDDRLLTLVYQPQFGMLSGAVCGAEALLRWEHPTLGTLEPSEFLPLVREHGLTDAVTDVVLSRAVADAAGWRAARTDIPVSVNLWARSLDEDSLPDRIMSVLDVHGMSARLLTVEITEELMVADFDKGRAVLNRLREAGIRVSIDDFGSGYSTLTYLRELPIDEVKLDRQLVAPILYDRRAATIARSVIELADELGIASVAEGVENDDTARWLRRFGCDMVQGNYFSGPLPAGEIPQVPSVAARTGPLAH